MNSTVYVCFIIIKGASSEICDYSINNYFLRLHIEHMYLNLDLDILFSV